MAEHSVDAKDVLHDREQGEVVDVRAQFLPDLATNRVHMSLAEFDRTTDQAMEAVGILSGGCVDACAVRTSLGAMIMAFTRMLERSTLTGATYGSRCMKRRPRRIDRRI